MDRGGAGAQGRVRRGGAGMGAQAPNVLLQVLCHRSKIFWLVKAGRAQCFRFACQNSRQALCVRPLPDQNLHPSPVSNPERFPLRIGIRTQQTDASIFSTQGSGLVPVDF